MNSGSNATAQEVAMNQPELKGPTLFLDQLGEDVYYDVASRFMMTMTKTELHELTSIHDLQMDQDLSGIVSFESMEVIQLDHDYNYVEKESGESAEFNEAQLALLKSLPYSADLLIRADFLESNGFGGYSNNYTSPHITIVPEQQAVYSEGKDALKAFIQKNTFDINVGAGKLQPGKVRFTIDQKGNVGNIFLESSSGFDAFDNKVMELMNQMPGTWTPAEDMNGNTVPQELVFSFGVVGC